MKILKRQFAAFVVCVLILALWQGFLYAQKPPDERILVVQDASVVDVVSGAVRAD
jgi:hypothetical protein